MIRLDGVTAIEHGRAVLDRASFDFTPGIWHLADEHNGDARLLIDVLAANRGVAGGVVRCEGARSWPIAQAASLGAHLNGLDMIDMLASLYALERRATQCLFQEMFDRPEWLPVRFDRWPPILRRHFGHIAILAPVFDVYLLDVSPVLPESDFYSRWRSLFQQRIAGKIVIAASGDHHAARRDFPGARLLLADGALRLGERPAPPQRALAAE